MSLGTFLQLETASMKEAISEVNHGMFQFCGFYGYLF